MLVEAVETLRVADQDADTSDKGSDFSEYGSATLLVRVRGILASQTSGTKTQDVVVGGVN